MAYGAPDIPACSLAESNFGSQVSPGPLQEGLGRLFFGKRKKKNGQRKSQILQVRRRLAIRNEKEEHILCFDT